MENEVWKTIVGWEGYYEVSNMGNVRSVDRYVKNPHGTKSLKRGKAMLPFTNRFKGRMATFNRTGNRNKKYQVHRLVAIAFIPNPNNLPEVNHLKGRLDDRAESLEWSSQIDNIHHAIDNGLNNQRGENHSNAKLKEVDVLAIRNSKDTSKILSEKYGVKQVTIVAIRNRRIWKKLP